ncbi:beta-ketoacyl-ACP synthase [Vibrio sp. WJH972]
MSKHVYIEDMAVSCAIGYESNTILHNMRTGLAPGLKPWKEVLYSGREAYVATITHELDDVNDASIVNNRNNQLASFLCSELEPSLTKLRQRYASHRIGVVIGSSTSGIEKTEQQIAEKVRTGEFPQDYTYQHQEMGDVSQVVASLAGATGPIYSVSTACTSSSRAFISAAKLIQSGICDAVICGGVDTLCHLTVNGFDSIEQVSSEPCRPFDPDRKGINVGEGGALFILTADKSDIELAGYGESSDAHHLSSPLPCGSGAYDSMQQALANAQCSTEQVDYINAHGTSTQQNDAMESKAISDLFSTSIPVSSTKALTGHCLGAAGAVEIAIGCLILRHPDEPLPKQWPSQRKVDINIPQIQLVEEELIVEPKVVLSNSFAFGGNNVSLIIKKTL